MKILVATDGSELGARAVDHGIRLAKSVGAKLVIVNVAQSLSSLNMAGEGAFGDIASTQNIEKSIEKASKKILDDAAAAADSRGITSEVRLQRGRKPAEAILETADADDCDLIVMSSHGRRGLRRAILGSQAAEVIALSNRPVLIVR